MESAAVPVPAAAQTRGETIAVERVGRMVFWYISASTLFFFVAGLLGVLMRESQANVITLDTNWFYAIMTAHGLGAFVAWAAFAVMGLGFWVLRENEMPMRKLGYSLAWIAWWTMVIGTLGIVVTTVGMQFGASWVFLYPLPFHAAGQWSDAATGIFAFSVLLTGVSIITWGMAIVNTVIGPGLQAESDGLFQRFACGLGMGYVMPAKFKMRRALPYPALPLMVIAIDMIIATLPLAALLVIMIGQSIDSSISVDPLLAKNMLWFFGHPVVYLLLFPAVAIYYHLIPKYAKRELVAGRVVAFAWLIAVTVNILVWAHHIYLDYPNNTVQANLNIAMQPLTFAIVAPSAISLYSLSATIWKSDFQWTIAAKFLAAALLSWFVAGLSGIVNATIAFDVVVHNTMWIVGHFHNMALLNIGMVVFAGIYAFIPSITGKEWYSERLGNWHMWLTLIGGYGMLIPMLIAGLEGDPRRYAVEPARFDTFNQISVPFALLTAVAQIFFAWNLIQTLRGKVQKEGESHVSGNFAFGGMLAVGVAAIALISVVTNTGTRPPEPKIPSGAAAGTTTPTAPDGAQLFSDNCASCHTLAAAQSTGTVGPNLDKVKPTDAQVLAALKNGGLGSGTMPKNLVTGADAAAVAKYVSSNAGK